MELQYFNPSLAGSLTDMDTGASVKNNPRLAGANRGFVMQLCKGASLIMLVRIYVGELEKLIFIYDKYFKVNLVAPGCAVKIF